MMATPKKPDLTTLTEPERMTLLQDLVLSKFIEAMSSSKPVPAALLVAASRYLASEPVVAALRKAQATAAKKQATAVAPLELPTFEPYDPEEWDTKAPSTAPQETAGATIPVPRYGDPEDHL
jgi:hypothetical protein